MSAGAIKHYRWRRVGEFSDIGINADGSLHNPNGYPEDRVREAALRADRHKEQKLIELRQRAVEKRKRRKEERIAKIAQDFLLGKHIGNSPTCASCNKPLTDPESIARGLGSDCWPSIMEHLSRMAPQCEANIVKYRDQIAELEKQDFDFHLAQKAYLQDPEWRQQSAAVSYKDTLRRIEGFKGLLADAEILLAAARRWNSPLLAQA